MIEWVITSSVLIAVVIALRFLFRRRISRRLQYALWGLVLLRLLMPVSLFGSSLSIMNAVPGSSSGESQNMLSMAQAVGEVPDDTIGYVDFVVSNGLTDTAASGAEANAPRDAGKMPIGEVLSLVWLIGSIVMGLWFVGTNLLFYRKLRKNREAFSSSGCNLPVYVTDHVASPCLFGIIRPAIYLTPKAVSTGDSTRHVLAHELCHYNHGDHIWSMLRGLCLAIWWWNPLVWMAAILSRTDGELACDEAVVRKIGAENRFSYGHTLVDMIAVRKAPSIMYAATTMVSGKRGIKERLNMIIKNPKTVISAVMAVLLIAAVCVGCTFTGAERGHDQAQGNEDVSAYAQQLYDCRVPYIGSAPDDAALIEAMNISEELGGYTLELETDSEPYVLRLIFSDKITDADRLNRAMQENGMLLLALIDNASEIQWRYTYSDPAAEGEESFTGSLTIEDANAMLNDTDIKEYGQSAAKVQALLDWNIVFFATANRAGAEISLDGGEQKILPKRYDKNKFDFDYDSLPALQVTGGSGTLIIKLESDEDTIRVGEDYYVAYNGIDNTERQDTIRVGEDYYTSNFIDKETYVLERENDETFHLSVKMRGNTYDEHIFYFVETTEDLYVFKVDFLLEETADSDIGQNADGEKNPSQAWFAGETYLGNHAYADFTLSDETRMRLLLSQPVRQDDTGIWCVERWADEDGSETLVTPDTDSPAMEYYQQLQESCDNGHRPGLLDPKQVAMEYITGILGQSVTLDGPTIITLRPAQDIDRTDLDACVSYAILSANISLGQTGYPTAAHTVLKTVENGNETTVYAMALYLEFSFTGVRLSETGGSHMPVAITFEKNDAGEYVLTKYWEPQDGSEYAPSIAEKFPSDIYEDALDTQKYITAHIQSCYAQMIASGGIDVYAQIAGLIETIASSPAEASAPQAYIDDHEMEYRELVYLGEYTLRYCFSLFAQDGQTGLKGHIMAAACQEILGDAGDINTPAATGQAWYDALSQSVKNQYR